MLWKTKCPRAHVGRSMLLAVWLGPWGCDNDDAGVSASTGAELEAPAQALKNEQAPEPEGPLRAGQRVYDFNALAHTGQRVELSQFLDKPVVVYFCPSDREPLCTDLATTLRDAWLDLNSHVSMVFGVSPEGTVLHSAFSSRHKLPHLLLADDNGSVHRVFGLQPGMAASYLIGKDRTILRVLPVSGGAQHVAALKQALAELDLVKNPYPI